MSETCKSNESAQAMPRKSTGDELVTNEVSTQRGHRNCWAEIHFGISAQLFWDTKAQQLFVGSIIPRARRPAANFAAGAIVLIQETDYAHIIRGSAIPWLIIHARWGRCGSFRQRGV